MPLAETLAFSLGPVIAKSILKRWLKEGVVLEVASSLTDTLKTSISDAFARERTADQFKAIGRQVAESLKQFFESEGASLDEEAQERIARALAETLDRAALNAKILIAQNLNSVLLYEQLSREFAGAMDGFAEAEIAFYERLLKETCKYIMDIAANLPLFQTEAFRAMIAKENELLQLAQTILQELDRIRKEAIRHNPEAEAQEFEADYLQEVLQTQDEVKLFGTELSDAQRRYRLSVAYVTLSVRQGKSFLADEEGGAGDVSVGIIGPVDEMLAQSQRLLLRGLAGSGKTTLLQWIAVHSARHDFVGGLAEWNNTIPFLIQLRKFAHKELPHYEAFPQLISEYVRRPPEGWVREQLESGRALVLIDGIDEIPTVQRDAAREWIKGLSNRFPVRIIVTARPHAVEEGWLDVGGFAEADLQPMDLENILAFVDHWREAVCGGLTDEREQKRLTQHAARLKLTIEERLTVRDLATSPLLCAMLCSLHRDRDEKIPTRRTELYEACIKMLLARDRARLINEDEYPKLDDTQKRRLLEQIAYWMLENGYSWAAQEDVRGVIEPRMRDLQLPDMETAERVLRLLVERTGVVREPVREQMDFAHRTFLEFLAAQYALDTNRIGVLVQNAFDDNWRETVILAAGLGRREVNLKSTFGKPLAKLWPSETTPGRITEGEGIIAALLLEGDRKSTQRPALHLLAVACMETAVELSMETRREVEQRLSRLDAPQNNAQALAFGSAGEMALPYLVAKEGQSEAVAAACVRALASIGTTAALDRIVAYATTTSEAVRGELCRAWERFDQKAYAQRVLAIVYPETYLTVTEVNLLKHLRYYVNLTALNLSGTEVSDVSALSSLTALTSLNLSYTQMSDISALSSLTALTSLNLSYTQVSDVSALSSLTALTSLNLYNTKVSDVSSLSSLTALITLDLSRTEVSDVSALSSLTALTSLSLSYTQVSDVSTLSSLTALTTLYLYNTKVSDVSVLSSLTALTSLNLIGLSQDVYQQWQHILGERKKQKASFAATSLSPEAVPASSFTIASLQEN